MPVIEDQDLPVVAKNVTSLISKSDSLLKDFLKLLLTIYTPVTSGLFFVASSVDESSAFMKFSFLVVFTSSALIALSSVAIFYVYFLISRSSARVYIDHVNKTGKHLNKQFGGKPWQTKSINCLELIVISLLLVNILSTITYVFALVL